MKKGNRILLAALTAAILGIQATPANAEVSLHISLGGPRAVACHPLYHHGYFYHTGYAPNLLFVPQLGFYVSIGLPFDLLFFDNFYYVYHSGYWYHSPYYYGPWKVVRHKRLPHSIRRHEWRTVRSYCDRQYKRHSRHHRWLDHPRHHKTVKRKSIRNSPYYHRNADHPRHYRAVTHKNIRNNPSYHRGPDHPHHHRAGKHKSIRNSPHYHGGKDHRHQAYKNSPGHEGKTYKKQYRKPPKNERKEFYRNRQQDHGKKKYRVRSTERNTTAYKARKAPDHKTLYRERVTSKTWKKKSGEKVFVKEKSRETKRWANQNNRSTKRNWTEKKHRSRDGHLYSHRNRSEKQSKERGWRSSQQHEKRWNR